jgi:hypothetical protein
VSHPYRCRPASPIEPAGQVLASSGVFSLFGHHAIKVNCNWLASEDYADARIPYALLRDGQCTVYEAHPIRCRRWNSVDSAACEAGFHDARAAIVPVDAYAFAAGEGVQAGLHAGVTQLGLDGRRYELHGAVWRALEVADAADQWVRSAAVFRDCTPIERG